MRPLQQVRICSVAALVVVVCAGRRYADEIHNVDSSAGLHHHVSYDAELGEHTVLLQELQELQSVECSGLTMLTFASRAACEAGHNLTGHSRTVLVGVPPLYCVHDDMRDRRAPAAMLRHVDGVAAACAADSNSSWSLQLYTSRAHLHHAFKAAKIRMRSNAHANGTRAAELGMTRGPEYAHVPGVPTQVDMEKLGCWFCWIADAFTAVVQAVVDVATAVVSAIETVWTIVSALATGQFSVDNTQQLASWSYELNVGFGDGMNGLLNCTSCGISITADFVLEVDIEDYSLVSAAVLLQGSAGMWANALASLDGNMTMQSAPYPIGSVSMPSIQFDAGPIPVYITFDIPLAAQWAITSTGQVSFESLASYQGSVSYGVQYNTTAGWTYVHDVSMVHNGSIPTLGLNSQFTLSLSFLPTLVIQIDYIGGPVIALRATAEATLMSDVSSQCPPVPGLNAGLTLGVNINLDSTIAANVSITIGSTNLVSWQSQALTIYSVKFPLFSDCIIMKGSRFEQPYLLTDGEGSGMEELDSGTTTTHTGTTSTTTGNVAVNSVFTALGSVWVGNQTRTNSDPSCNAVPDYLDVFAQAMVADDQTPQLLQTVSGNWQNGIGYCIFQVAFALTAPDTQHVTVTPLNNNLYLQQCQGNSTSWSVGATQQTLTVSKGARELSLFSDCAQYVVRRAVGKIGAP